MHTSKTHTYNTKYDDDDDDEVAGKKRRKIYIVCCAFIYINNK